MAISKNGMFGNPNGKIGPVIFYELNGQLVSRTIGAQRPPTKKQLDNQQRMAVTMEMMVPMLEFIKLGFAGKAKGTTSSPFNLATSHTKKYALQGEYPNISIDYNQVVLSSGNLPAADHVSITKTATGMTFSWDATFTTGRANDDDLVMIATYHPVDGISRIHRNAAKRSEGSCFIPMEREKWHNEPIEAYLCFRSSDGEQVSDSLYAGNLNGTAQKEQEKAKYEVVKAHFDKIEAVYLKQKKSLFESGTTNKAYRHLEKEYQMLKIKLQHLPGKPV